MWCTKRIPTPLEFLIREQGPSNRTSYLTGVIIGRLNKRQKTKDYVIYHYVIYSRLSNSYNSYNLFAFNIEQGKNVIDSTLNEDRQSNWFSIERR